VAPHPEPFFLTLGEGALGQRFALHHAPHTGPAQGLVVYVHPFAEEMNKSRRMAALQARALAAAGYAVLQVDLLGCGDSGGDFADATWAQWVDDVVHACGWLRHRHAPPAGQAPPPLWLWGLRVGCLLAVEAAAKIDGECSFLFWQPTTAGNTALQQFLRLKLAGELLDGNAKGAMATLRQQLADGQAAEIAGYSLNPALAVGLERTALRPFARPFHVEWLEVTTSADGGLSPASARCAEHWQQAGCQVRTRVVTGPAFWQTTEIEEAPELLSATTAAMSQTCGREHIGPLATSIAG
jgi:exosortase A-associated hydrolase 2